MEKITYTPLIEHLKESGDQYNQMYREYELRFGGIPAALLSSWIVSTIQPIIAAAGEPHVAKVFPIMFRNLLSLLGSQLAITYEQEYRSSWLMLLKNPHLIQTSPSRVLSAVNSAAHSIRKYQPEKVVSWIASMEQHIPYCKTLEEFLACGRVCAWLCGMAHLRTKATSDIPLLSDEFREAIEKNAGLNLTDLATRLWESAQPHFMGVAGGFAGMGGPFKALPRVALLDDHIIATDSMSTCAVFADPFGSVLIPDVPFSPQHVNASAGSDSLRKFVSQFGGQIIPFDDVTSAVIKDNTLVLTRQSSFHLYIYGWHV